MRSSTGFSTTASTASASGSTATVQADVWTSLRLGFRDALDAMAPDSNRLRYAPWPTIRAMTSL